MSRLDEVRMHRDAILLIAEQFGALRLRIFGSVVRGEARRDSDLDVLVAFEPGRSLLDQVGLEQELASLLGCPVEVVAEGGLSPHLEARILQEAIPL